MANIISLMLLVVAVIHLLPVSGVLGAERLAILYGLQFTDSSVLVLMRHRAVLFGLLGVFFIYAAFKPSYQVLAMVAGFASVLSFLAIAALHSDFNQAVGNIVKADVLALLCLSVAAVLYYVNTGSGH